MASCYFSSGGAALLVAMFAQIGGASTFIQVKVLACSNDSLEDHVHI